MRNASFSWRLRRTSHAAALLWILCAVLHLSVERAEALGPSLKRCERTIAGQLAHCFQRVSSRLNECYLGTGAACPDADFDRYLDRMSAKVTAKCTDSDVQQLGYGTMLTVSAMNERLRESCRGEANTLAARTFGGPHAAVLASASADGVACLTAAADSAVRMIRKTFTAQSRCVRREHRGRACNTARVDAKLEKEEERATSVLADACPDLPSLVGIDMDDYRDRALAQARCMVATAHGDTGPLSLDCGPRPEVTAPTRGQWTLIVLDESVWGTRCGDGSPYAFWLRLAPNGSPLENVIVDLQGGGVCTSESECLGVSAGLFKATDNYQPNGPDGGYRSVDPNINPFWDWTMIALAYCNQDVYGGGGLTTVFPGITVHRFGAINIRAGLRYLRDVLWQELNATTPEGYRPDRLRVLFGGVSAGGFGVSYNYHYLLDDLRWVNTTAAPDSALGLNNGSVLGVTGLGILINGPWGGLPYQQPYCLVPACAVVPYRQTLASPRLKATPLQQILNISNQVDNTQTNTTFFSSSAAWTNAARKAYCNTQGLPGIHYFLPAGATSLHGMLQSNSRFTSITSDGIVLRDWLSAAMNDPENVVDLVEEGTLASSSSIDPFPCVVD